jgi:hypothetical protein
LGEQPVQDGIVRRRVALIAQQPNEPRTEPHPIREHRLREQIFDFFNPFVRHLSLAQYPKRRAKETLSKLVR